jgi:hypothetical protein
VVQREDTTTESSGRLHLDVDIERALEAPLRPTFDREPYTNPVRGAGRPLFARALLSNEKPVGLLFERDEDAAAGVPATHEATANEKPVGLLFERDEDAAAGVPATHEATANEKPVGLLFERDANGKEGACPGA